MGSEGDGSAAAGRLARLPKSRRQRIATLTGCAHSDAASLIDHLSKRSIAKGILESLSPEGIVLTRLLVEAADLLPASMAEREATIRLGDLAADATSELEAMGILMRTNWAGGAELVGLLPPLARSMRPFVWLLGDDESAEIRQPETLAQRASLNLPRLRDLVLVTAAVATETPRLARDGSAHGADLSRLHRDRLEATIPSPGAVDSHVRRLFSLGLLAGDAEGRVRVRWKRAEALFGLPAASRLPLLLSTDDTGDNGFRAQEVAPVGRVRRLLVAGLGELPSGRFVLRRSLEKAISLRLLAADNSTPYGDPKKVSITAARQTRRVMESLLPCLDLHGTGEDLWVRLPRPEEPTEEAGWLVQPDHEIIVPPEVSCLDLTRLASVANLVRAETVAQFHIGPESIARAVEAGLDTESIMERLSSRAARGLPEGLELQIQDWARQSNPCARRALSPDEEAECLSSSHRERETTTRGGATPPHLLPSAPSLPPRPRTDFGTDVARLRTGLATRVKDLAVPDSR